MPIRNPKFSLTTTKLSQMFLIMVVQGTFKHNAHMYTFI